MAEQDKRTHKGIASFESGRGNTMEIEFLKVINGVKEIAIKDLEDKKVKYGTKINSAQEYIYYVSQFLGKPTEEDLKLVKWAFWLDKTQKELSEKYFLVEETAEKEDVKEDFLLKSTNEDTTAKQKEDFKAVKDNGVLYAKIETAEVDIDGTKTETAVLRVKFSKWLDGKMIKMEACTDEEHLTLKSSNAFVASRELQAKPEILEVYWTSKDGERIKKTGYSEEIYMHFVSLGLKDKTVEGLLLEKDDDTQTSMSPKGDRIEWKNNKFKVDSREFKRQFKVGTKDRYKDAREEDVATNKKEAFKILIQQKKTKEEQSEEKKTKEDNEELELFFEVQNADKLELVEAKQQYGSLILTPQNNIVDAYFAKITDETMALDAPLQTLKNKTKGNKKGKVEQHEKLSEGVIGQKIKLVAEVDNLENGTEIVFQLFEKTPLLTTKDTALKIVQDSTETDEVIAKVKDGYAVVEIELRPKADADFKKWLTTLKIDGKPSDRKKSYLFIEAKEKDNPSIKEFYEEQGFKVISTNWHEPVDDPQIAIYNQHGYEKAASNTFGMGRLRFHDGLDIFALEGSNVYACLDAKVHSIQKWTSKKESGYGHNVILKVINAQEFRNRKREYKKPFTTDLDKKSLFDENHHNIYLRYCHLESIDVVKGQNVKAGQIIGKSGVSGIAIGTHDPHLHFNIGSTKSKSKAHLVNPAYYVYWKELKQLTKQDKEIQKSRKDEGYKPNPVP